MLPGGFVHHICSFTTDGKKDDFKAVITLPLSTKEEIQEWKAEFEKKTLTTFRVEKKYKDDGQKLLYKVTGNSFY